MRTRKMRIGFRIRFSMRTLLIATSVTAVIASYFAVVLPPRLKNKHAIDVLIIKHNGFCATDGSYGPRWMRAILPMSYTMGIHTLGFYSPAIDDSTIPEIENAIKSLPSTVRHLEFIGTNISTSGQEKLKSTFPDCNILVTPRITNAGPGTAVAPAR